MKKILFILAAGLFALTACQKQAQVSETIYSVDQIYAQGDSLVGDTILVAGNCLHLCKHGGRKAFLNGSTEGQFLRAEAVGFESFAPECINNSLRIRGVLHALDVPAEVQAAEKEHQHAEGEGACGVCSAVRRFYMEALDYTILEE